jgi:hypothetical protein
MLRRARILLAIQTHRKTTIANQIAAGQPHSPKNPANRLNADWSGATSFIDMVIIESDRSRKSADNRPIGNIVKMNIAETTHWPTAGTQTAASKTAITQAAHGIGNLPA